VSRLSREEVVKRLRSIKLLALDVDGVLTDDTLMFGPDGFEAKRFNISDGLYMVLAQRAGLEIAIISGRYSPATDSRMTDLGIKHVLQKKLDKTKQIAPLMETLNFEYEDIAFMGNEILDIKLSQKVGLAIGVADSCKELLDVVGYVTERKGGEGAVREVLELWFEAIGKSAQEFLV
jgi:3-deoxy-D-manno-octulosonate 8-phosphate phosphatase (KDO 8-P phosphatase)